MKVMDLLLCLANETVFPLTKVYFKVQFLLGRETLARVPAEVSPSTAKRASDSNMRFAPSHEAHHLLFCTLRRFK